MKISLGRVLALMAAWFLPGVILAQEKPSPGVPSPQLTISGKLLSAEDNEPLIGAAVYAPAFKAGVVADLEGSFSLTISGTDTATILYSYVGTVGKRVFYGKSTFRERLHLASSSLQDIVIDVERDPTQRVARTEMSVERLDMRQAKLLPALFGEVDILRLLQLRPGVQSGGEGTTGIYVRGGGPDQNLFLVDEAVVYNPSHLFGFLSVFNSDAVKGIDLYKGGFPANYGGRLSSVVDVKMRDGNKDTFRVTGGVGLIASRLTVEGPLQKGKSSFLFSARRTYFDVFTRQYNRVKERQNDPLFNPIPDYYFYDLNGRLTFDLTPRDKLIINGYYGQDRFAFARRAFKFNFDWGNRALSVRLVHKHDRRTFTEASLALTDYRYTIRNAFDQFSFRLGSGITDVTGRLQWTRNTLGNHYLTAGATVTSHIFTIGRLQGGGSDKASAFSAGQTLQAAEYGVYLSDKFDVGPRTEVIAGVRASGMVRDGKTYSGLEPRLTARYTLTEKASLKASYGRTYQYLHLVSSSGSSIPTDLWYPSGPIVKPQIADQVAGGYNLSLWGNKFFFSNEYYYKRMQRQIDFKDGANLFINGALDTTFVFGKGWAYGTEFFLEKKTGKTTGWIGYTLAWTWRQFDAINDGRAFHPRYDRRHDISVVISHQLSPRVTLSGTWVYGTGNAVTLPVARGYLQDIPGTIGTPPGVSVVPIVKERNSFRMASYHRADVALIWRVGKRRNDDLSFSVYNLYSRMNPYFIYLETKTQNPDGTGKITGYAAKQVSLFPIIPSVAYNFRF